MPRRLAIGLREASVGPNISKVLVSAYPINRASKTLLGNL